MNGLYVFFAVILGLILLGFFTWFLSLVIPALPTGLGAGNVQTTANTVYNNFKTTADNSVTIILIILVVADLVISWLYPNPIVAIGNIVGLFALGIFNEYSQSVIAPIVNSFSTNTNLPTTYGFILGNNGYVFLFVLGFAMVVSIIFNVRRQD